MTAPVMPTSLPFGLHDVKIYPFLDAFGTILANEGFDLPNAQTFSFADSEDFTDLRGDDELVASHGNGAQVNWTLEAGGVDLRVWAIFTGGQIIESGVAPNRVITLRKCSDDQRPYFQVRGLVLSDSGGDMTGVVYRAKCNGDISGQFADGQFFITSADGIGLSIPGTKLLYDLIQHETRTFLSTTAPALPILPPKNLVAVPASATSGVSVWEPVTGVTGYRVQISDDGGSSYDIAGPTPVNEVQTITVTGSAGTFSIGDGTNTQSGIAYNAATSAVQTAVNALLGSGKVVVSGSAGSYILTYSGTEVAGTNVPTLIVAGTGGATASIAVTTQGVSQDIATASYTFTGLVAETDYLVRVASVIAGVASYYSEPVAFTTPSA